MGHASAVAVAPNGARYGKTDLPITPSELAETAGNCLEAGATIIHLHVRDKQQQYSLLPCLLKDLFKS